MSDITIERIDGEQLLERFHTEPENEDLFVKVANGTRQRRLKYVDGNRAKKMTYILALSGKRIIGAASLLPKYDDSGVLWVTAVSVEEAHRRQGIAGRLLEHVYAYAMQHGKVVRPTSFSEMGQWIEQRFDSLDEQYPQAACNEPHSYMI